MNNTRCYQKIFLNITCPNKTDTYNYECKNTTNIALALFGANATNMSLAGNETWEALPLCPPMPRMNKTSWTECFKDPDLYNTLVCQFVMVTNWTECVNNTDINMTLCKWTYEKNITKCN
jgi:hypothetical protein